MMRGTFTWCGVVGVALAAWLLTSGGAVTPAAADGPGGNCCADLEERVAELEATTAHKGNRKMSLTVSGQVSTALMFWDDGNKRDAYVVDNTVSRSGFEFEGSAKVTPNVRVGFELVLGIAAGARSEMVNQQDDDATVKTKLTTGAREEAEGVIEIELANWYIEHKHLGRLTLGRIGTASDNSISVDLGGAGVIASAEIGAWQQGFFLTRGSQQLDATWSLVFGGPTVSQAGLSRDNAISYTTPTVAGFQASVAWSDNDLWDAALRYAGEFSGLRVAAAVAYVSNRADGVLTEETRPTAWQGSAGILHVASGLYLSGAFVHQDNEDRPADTRLWYLQGGISRNWTGMGKTVLYAEYARVVDGITGCKDGCTDFGGQEFVDTITGSEATVWGLGIVQHIDAAAMELFLAYRRYAAEVTSPEGGYLSGTVSFNDFDVVMSGARIRF